MDSIFYFVYTRNIVLCSICKISWWYHRLSYLDINKFCWLSLLVVFMQTIWKNFSNPIVLNIGRNTMGIYTLHYFPLRCLQYLHDNGFINGVNLASTCYFCLSVLVIISLAYCMTILAGCNKYSSIVFLGKV